MEARVEAVIEPFKVRTISKGPARPYYIAKRLQKIVHTVMRQMPAFRLIGTPFCATHLMDVVEAQRKIGWKEGMEWLSIDYSAATDGLSARLSAEIMENILRKVAHKNIGLYRLLLQVLAPHYITYPKVSGVQLEGVQQKNGQLMGSVLSFPVLCIANLALYMRVKRSETEIPRRPVGFWQLAKAVLVNGDDMVYIGDRNLWLKHIQYGKQMGLEMSPGKAYIHPRYANINSTSVDYPLVPGATPYVVPFLNTGLYFGQHKVLGKVADQPEKVSVIEPYTTVIDEVVKGARTGKAGDIFKMYLALHKEDISRECKGRNLFVPRSAGGMGVQPVAGVKYFITDLQRNLAGGLVKRQPFLRPAERPLAFKRVLKEVDETKVIDPIHVPEELSTRVRREKGSQSLSEGMIFGFIAVDPKSAVVGPEESSIFEDPSIPLYADWSAPYRD